MKKNLKIPNHVAFIMDGNGRWAKKRLMPRNFGHLQGVKTVEKVVEACFDRGIKVVSLYAFSTENWKRPKEEIDKLFSLLDEFFDSHIKKLLKDGVKLTVMGDIEKLPLSTAEKIKKGIKDTENNDKYVLNIGINYGGRQEIVNAVNSAIKNGVTEFKEETITQYLYTSSLPEPDIVVRTSGEQRLSNFMLYQVAYSEFYFPKVLWPDFNKKHLEKTIKIFSKRNRRYGGV